MRARQWSPSIVAVQLDPVGASADLIADDARQAVDAVGFFGPLRHAPFGDELRLIASRGDDGFRRREHARTGHDALIHGLLQFDVGVLGPFGAEIANRGEAGHERVPQMVRCARDAQGQRFARHLIVPRRLVVRMQQHVRVPFDETWQQGGARQIDHPRARGAGSRVGADCLDAIAAHAHRPPVVRRVAVEHARRSENRDGSRWRLRRWQGDQQQQYEGRKNLSHAADYSEKRCDVLF